MDRLAVTKEYIRLVEKTLTELYEDNQRMREQIPEDNSAWLKWGDEKDKEIDRLRKEKEWLIKEYAKEISNYGTIASQIRSMGFIKKNMQQALEE